MALINCPECGSQVSDKAKTCPKCAYPLTITNASARTTDEKTEAVNEKKSFPAESHSKTIGKPFIQIPFALAIVFFFFTFCDLKCGDRTMVSITGFELVKGKDVSNLNLHSFYDEGISNDTTEPNPWAITAFCSAIIGLIVSLFSGKKEEYLGFLSGFTGFISLLILQYVIKDKLIENSASALSIQAVFQIGYWGALCSLAVAIVFSFLRTRQSEKLDNEPIILSSTSTPEDKQEVYSKAVKTTEKKIRRRIIWGTVIVIFLFIAIRLFSSIMDGTINLSQYNPFKSDEQRAIELVQITKATDINDDITWLEHANKRAKNEINKKYKWEGKITDEAGIYLVSFRDEEGWGISWEVTLNEKIVKFISGNDYLCMKYGFTKLDQDRIFLIANIKVDTLRVEKTKIQQDFWDALFSSPKYTTEIVYRYEADVRNTTDKYLSSANIKAELKLIFKDKTIVGASGESNLTPYVSKSNPWAPNEMRSFQIKTKDIEKIYLNYVPEYTVFEINLEAEDPIGFSYDKNILEDEISVKWKTFTDKIKQTEEAEKVN